ncbi:histidine kinase [Polymorphospora sp. NPDC051019]|uniref:sensor histidine kinase n=1 Tax=Polymorphospora sp. NPDC051019 TaxID=3155725 RepID=UPI00343A76C7
MTGLLGVGRGTLGRDLALAGLYLVGGLLIVATGAYREISPAPAEIRFLFSVTLAVTCAGVALRRVAPRAGLAVGTAGTVADVLLGVSLATILVYTQVLYDAVVYGPPRLWRWLLWITSALAVGLAVAGLVVVGSWTGVAAGIPAVLAGTLPVLTGLTVRQYRDQATAERDRAEKAARLAELDRRQAITAERTRMARELHDVVANHLSAVAIHSTAVLSVPGLERPRVEQALQVIRENSVQGLAEMRRMIDLLREPAAAGPETPALSRTVEPGLAGVDRLIAQARGAGLDVRLETTGTVRPLPANVDLAAYRIVQESLTNALKHGAGRAAVTVGYDPGLVRLVVSNPLPEVAGRGAALGAGAGLVGMRERAELLRGHFDAGRHGPTWLVRAELPTGGETA